MLQINNNTFSKKMNNQKKIALFSPSISSFNLGDHIIYDSARHHINSIIQDAYIVEISTHLPVSKYIKPLKDADYKFVCGSNLLRGKMNSLFRQWDINIF